MNMDGAKSEDAFVGGEDDQQQRGEQDEELLVWDKPGQHQIEGGTFEHDRNHVDEVQADEGIRGQPVGESGGGVLQRAQAVLPGEC